MRSATVLLAFLFLTACSADEPAGVEHSALQAEEALFRAGATGALPGLPEDLGDEMEAVDEAGNQDDVVCVKTVPEGDGNAPPRTIIKDNKNGECPGGFEEEELGGGPAPF